VYDDPGPYDAGGGWYSVGDDGSGAYTGDDGTSTDTSGDDGTGDDSSSSGNDSSGSTGDDSTGDDSSGDDGSGWIRPGRFARRRVPHRVRRHEGGAPAATMRVQTAPTTVIAAGPDSCHSCTLSCVLSAPAAGQANAATAMGGSDVSFEDACSNAQSELAAWAVNQGSSLQACRVGAAPFAMQSAPPPSASASAPALAGPIVRHGVSGAGRWVMSVSPK
jgi:hypothetical protein